MTTTTEREYDDNLVRWADAARRAFDQIVLAATLEDAEARDIVLSGLRAMAELLAECTQPVPPAA